MKHIKFLSVLLVSITCMRMNTAAQLLPEIKIVARNYKYLRSVDNQNVAQPVQLLERRAASYDVKRSEYYEDDYDSYAITLSSSRLHSCYL